MFKRRGELREATESLVVSLNVQIKNTEEDLEKLKKERTELKKKLDEDE